MNSLISIVLLFNYLDFQFTGRIAADRRSGLYLPDDETQGADMGAGPDGHSVVDHGRGVDVRLIFNDDSSNTGYMRVDPVPTADPGIMADHGIGLDHIVIPYDGIVADDRVGADKIAFPEACILVDAGRMVDQFDELPAPPDNLFHARAARTSADRGNEYVIPFRQIILNRADDGRIPFISIQRLQVIINKPFDSEDIPISDAFQCIAVDGPAHPAGPDDDEILHARFALISSSKIDSSCLAITSPEKRERTYSRIARGE